MDNRLVPIKAILEDKTLFFREMTFVLQLAVIQLHIGQGLHIN